MSYYFLQATKELVKEAEKSSAKKYLPWYGAAGLGGAGGMLAQEAVPKKYKIPAAVAGSLLGTAVGVHGGEALGKAIGKKKIAEKEEKKPKSPTILGTVGRGLGGLAVGTLAGYGAGKAVEAVGGKSVGRWVPSIATAAGAGLGAAYPLWKAYELETLRQIQARKAKEAVEKKGKSAI